MRFLTILSIVLCIFSFSILNAHAKTQTLDTQKLLLQKSYLQNINQCSSPKKLSQILTQALKNSNDYKVTALNAGMLEEIMLNNPACFMQAVNKLSYQTCEKVHDVFIEETYYYPRKQIKQSLSRTKGYYQSCMADSVS